MPVTIKHEAEHSEKGIIVRGVIESHNDKPIFPSDAPLTVGDVIRISPTPGGGFEYEFEVLPGRIEPSAADLDAVEADRLAAERTSGSHADIGDIANNPNA